MRDSAFSQETAIGYVDFRPPLRVEASKHQPRVSSESVVGGRLSPKKFVNLLLFM